MVLWYMPVISVSQEAEIGESKSNLSLGKAQDPI
jgi:hypothetical protein